MNDQQYITQFESYLICERRVSKNTLAAYKGDITQLVHFLQKLPATITSCTKNDLQQFLAWLHEMQLSKATISRKISALKLLYDFLHERHAQANIASGLLFPKLDARLPIYLTHEEINALLDAAQKDTTLRGIRNNLIVHLLYATGMRVSELCAITIDQIQFDTGFIKLVGKGSKERMLPLPIPTLDHIRMYLNSTYRELLPKSHKMVASDAYLFPMLLHGTMRPITRQSIWNIIKNLLLHAGITKNVSPHSLRHSLATHLLARGADLRSLQLLLGHENLTTVQIYTHLETKQLRLIYDKKHPRSK